MWMGRLDSIVDGKNRFHASQWNMEEITTTRMELQNLITNFLNSSFNTRQEFIHNIKRLVINTNIITTKTKRWVKPKSVPFRTENIDLQTLYFYIQLQGNELTRNANLHVTSIRRHLPPTLHLHHIHILNARGVKVLSEEYHCIYNSGQ